MKVFPAIDLKDGHCVRLERGDMTRATAFYDDPTEPAVRFRRAGFTHLHVVDLDGAIAGKPVNAAAVEALLVATDAAIQLGGGLRDMATIEHWLEKGVARVVLGTAALRDPELVKTACRAFPARVAVGIDTREGRVAIDGWVRESEVEGHELAARFADAGVAALIHTDIARDGVGLGVNIAASAALAESVPIPVIASGGVAGMDDIDHALEAENIAGLVIGRAFYDGRLDPADVYARVS